MPLGRSLEPAVPEQGNTTLPDPRVECSNKGQLGFRIALSDKGDGNLILVRILFLTLHLLAMNFAAAAPLLAVWLDIRGTKQQSPESTDLGKRVAWWSLGSLAIGILLGAGQLGLFWWVGYTDYFETLLRLWDSKIIYGFWEIAFSVACMIGYLVWWSCSARTSLWQRLASRTLSVVAATNLLYHFPTLFTIIGLLARTEDPQAGEITAAEFRALLIQPEVIGMTLHFWLASIAVSGLAVSLMAFRLGETADHRRISIRGSQVCLIATLLQLPVGFYYTSVLRVSEQARILGGNMPATLIFLAAVLAALWLIHLLVGVAVFQSERPKHWQTAAAMLITVALMTASMLLSRDGFPPVTT